MKTISIFAILFCLFAGLSGCVRAEGTNSEFCVLVGNSWEDAEEVISLLDPFAEDLGILRGQKSPNGIIYANANQRPDFVISVSPIGPIGVQVAFYPRKPNTFQSEKLALEDYVNDVISRKLDAILCSEREGYRAGVIYGFDGIRI